MTDCNQGDPPNLGESSRNHSIESILPSILNLTLNPEPDKLSGDDSQGINLLGRIVSKKPINQRTIKIILSKAWNLRKELLLYDWTPDILLFKFESLDIKSRIIAGSPWSVNGKLLVLGDIQMGSTPEEHSLSFSPFWIQAFGLPGNRLTVGNGEVIGNTVGKCVMVDPGAIRRRHHLRIQTVIDITKPLFPGFWLKRDHDSSSWVEIKYERLSDFCYKCGMIGHEDRECSSSPVVQGHCRVYGKWIRAPSNRSLLDRSISVFLAPLSSVSNGVDDSGTGGGNIHSKGDGDHGTVASSGNDLSSYVNFVRSHNHPPFKQNSPSSNNPGSSSNRDNSLNHTDVGSPHNLLPYQTSAKSIHPPETVWPTVVADYDILPKNIPTTDSGSRDIVSRDLPSSSSFEPNGPTLPKGPNQVFSHPQPINHDKPTVEFDWAMTKVFDCSFIKRSLDDISKSPCPKRKKGEVPNTLSCFDPQVLTQTFKSSMQQTKPKSGMKRRPKLRKLDRLNSGKRSMGSEKASGQGSQFFQQAEEAGYAMPPTSPC